MKTFREAAKALHGYILFVVSGTMEGEGKRLAEFFEIEHTPQFRLFTNDKGRPRKYIFNPDF